MTKWEYKHVCAISDTALSEYGQEGWELISVVVITDLHTHYFFKRPLLSATLQEDMLDACEQGTA